MPSMRLKLKENANGSKNTRLDIGIAAARGDLRTDVLGHLSRYGRIVDLLLDEADRLKRPLTTLDIGCGEMYPLRILCAAKVVQKNTVIESCVGVDIDPYCQKALEDFPAVARLCNARVALQDLTLNPRIPVDDDSIDFAWTTEVIEHMGREFVEPWISDVKRVLRPGGLFYVSTPNHDGSRSKLPKDHVYEWGFDELRALLKRYFFLEYVTGTFIQLPAFRRANREHQIIPETLVNVFESRFSNEWLRNVLAAPYPEYANNAAWVLRKPA